MPQYEFKCPECQHRYTVEDKDGPWYCLNHKYGPSPRLKRVFGFSLVKPMQEHYNPTTGTVVSNSRQFRDGLKVASDRETARTGIEHNYVEVDPTDAKALGVTEEGLDTTARRLVAEGKKDVKTYL